MLDIQNPNNANKWHCPRCNTWNESDKTRCSWCSFAKELAITTPQGPSPEEKLTQQLHQIIEKLSPRDKKRLFAWLEDNVL